MKRFLSFILVVAIIAAGIYFANKYGVINCSEIIDRITGNIDDGDQGGHEHEYEWVYGEAHHWQKCKDEDCEYTSNTEEHSFEWKIDVEPTTTQNGKKHEECKCGLIKNADTPIQKLPSASGRQVDEQAFYKALSFEGVTSYVLEMEATNGELTEKQDIYVQDNKAYYYSSDNSGANYFAEEVGSYTYLYIQQGGRYYRTRTDQMDIVIRPSDLGYSFITLSQINYNDFVFVDGVYVGTMKVSGKIANVQLVFNSNNQLSYCSVEQKIDGETVCTTMDISGYNATTVSLPENYVSN